MARKMPNRMSKRAGKIQRKLLKGANRAERDQELNIKAMRQLSWAWARAQVARETPSCD